MTKLDYVALVGRDICKYVNAVKRGLRDVYGFEPEANLAGDEPIFAPGEVPDGIYPLVIDGKVDIVSIEDGRIDCQNWVKIPAKVATE
jgi:hypothetical protein